VDISGSQGLACEFAKDVQKREFLGLDAKFEFTAHFNFASLKMLLWPTAATWAGARELDERVSTRLFGTCMSCTHLLHLTSGCRGADRCAQLRPPMRWCRCVHDMHVPNSLVDTRSSSPRAPAQVAAVGHESNFHTASLASSLNEERRINISNMPEIGKTQKGWQGLIPGPSQ